MEAAVYAPPVAAPRAVQLRLTGLSVVIPCHNERDNVAAAVAAARSAAERFALHYEIVVVDDERNRGYGAAVRSGIRSATMPWILLTDGDLQFDLSELEGFVRRAAEADLVVGRRASRADPFGRRAAAAMWNALVRILFRLPVRDVDCAFKLMRSSLVQELDLTADGAMVSTELLARALASGAAVVELDVTHLPRLAGEQSGGSTRVIARALRELVVVGRSLKVAPQ